MNTRLVIAAALALTSCAPKAEQPAATAAVTKVDTAFTAKGIEMNLDGGTYSVRYGPDGHIRVSFGPDSGGAVAEFEPTDGGAHLAIKNTPRKNFQATIELPATTDLNVRMTAGNLAISGLIGNKEVDNKAGNVDISGLNPNDYGSVDASLIAGDIEAGPFGQSSSGLGPHLTWSGQGKYHLHATLGAGNLKLKR